ncbi:MAG: GTPase HflX [Desulfovibrio sp.]|nr:GTPase HflX [Desulfovibrio sp.]
MGRQVALLIDRKGRVVMVLVGDATGILIPELPRARVGAERLRGLRLLHTHLSMDGLSKEDLTDLLFLRLDAVIALNVSPEGAPVQWQSAHLLPSGVGPPYSLSKLTPWDHTEAYFTVTAEGIETELARRNEASRETSGETGAPRALLVSVNSCPQAAQENNLNELAELALTAGLQVVGRMVQRVPQINPRSILGKGKLTELEVLALQEHADMLVFDGELSPAQLHNLTDITERKVIDRTQLILDIFAQHAVSRVGKLQVELAQLRYTQPRLAGKNRAMDRLMGGIGGRGPGETKLETDRRRSRERITRIRKELERIRRQRAFTRARRSRALIPLAALVGYTNAGKSTLLNTLTRSHILAQNKLFATLDTTTRRLPRGNGLSTEREIIVADTVGFIRGLPEELKVAFHATLEELEAADMLLHVADASHPDLAQQITSVESILSEMGIDQKPRLLVLNKWDRLDQTARAELAAAFPIDDFSWALPVCATTGEGLKNLLGRIEQTLLA